MSLNLIEPRDYQKNEIFDPWLSLNLDSIDTTPSNIKRRGSRPEVA